MVLRRFCSYCGKPDDACPMNYAGATGCICHDCADNPEVLDDFATRHLQFLDEREGELYDMAKRVTHSMGLPWTDPRTRKVYPAPAQEG